MAIPILKKILKIITYMQFCEIMQFLFLAFYF